MCLCFEGLKPVLEGFTDANFAGDLNRQLFTSGYLFTFVGGAISWQFKLQKCTALSTTEAEYMAANEAGKNFFREPGLKQGEYVVYYDCQSAMYLSKNATYHAVRSTLM